MIVNTGAFEWPGRPRGVVIEHGRLTVRAIVRQQDAWCWGRRVIASYAMDTASPQLLQAVAA